MLYSQASAALKETLSSAQVSEVLARGLAGRFTGARLLVLIPDHTRSLPLPMLFRQLTEVLHDVRQLDFMVALGTHPPLDQASLHRLVGITADEAASTYRQIGLLNHDWNSPMALAQLGVISQAQVQQLAGSYWHPSLGGDVTVRINRLALEYDHILILGPTFPHEVVGFSGGAKYLFPGISGAEMINVTHWLGALMTVRETIGVRDTPVRALIHAAAALLPTPVTLVALTVTHDDIASMFIGEMVAAWRAAADDSAQRHIVWVDQPYQRVLSAAPAMYDELWVAAKAMYKLDPAIAEGGEIIVYAPHLSEVSVVHGANIRRVGYHVRDYFLKQWEQFRDVPLGVIAHSTHLKGSGEFVDGIETPRIHVSLASGISAQDCAQLNLGYVDAASIRVDEWQGRESEGVLYVPKAGEMLYRVRG